MLLVREKFQDERKERYVYISHEHRVHFDPEFLATLPENGFHFVVPHFHRPARGEELTQIRPEEVISCRHREQIKIRGGSLRLYLNDSGLARDSAVLLKADGQTFLSLDDRKLYAEVATTAKHEGPISAFACQFSGATHHPTC